MSTDDILLCCGSMQHAVQHICIRIISIHRRYKSRRPFKLLYRNVVRAALVFGVRASTRVLVASGKRGESRQSRLPFDAKRASKRRLGPSMRDTAQKLSQSRRVNQSRGINPVFYTVANQWEHFIGRRRNAGRVFAEGGWGGGGSGAHPSRSGGIAWVGGCPSRYARGLSAIVSRGSLRRSQLN